METNKITYRITILKRTNENDPDECISLLSRIEDSQRQIIDFGWRHTFLKVALQTIFNKVCSIIRENHLGENVLIDILDLSDKIVYQEFLNDLDLMGLEKTLDFYEKTWGEVNNQKIRRA
jgi:hypothetical protein